MVRIRVGVKVRVRVMVVENVEGGMDESSHDSQCGGCFQLPILPPPKRETACATPQPFHLNSMGELGEGVLVVLGWF